MSAPGPIPALRDGLLWPLALPYAAVIAARNLYYDVAPGAVRRAAIPVISVGNLAAGGTGKTPLVIEIIHRLRALGRRPAILTRGYKAAPGAVADEVLEFRDALPDTPVIVNADRVSGAITARVAHAADCAVLDDGFQHRRLARQLDIVLLDALRPWAGGLLPAGRAREPRGALQRADVFVITRTNQVTPQEVAALTAELRHYGKQPVVLAAVEPAAIVARDGRPRVPCDLRGRRLLAVCGIGNPQTFARLMTALTGPCELLTFSDHQSYGPRQLEAICAAARRSGAAEVVTTRKDWVKLAPRWPADGPELVRLDMRLVLSGATAELDARLRQAVESPL